MQHLKTLPRDVPPDWTDNAGTIFWGGGEGVNTTIISEDKNVKTWRDFGQLLTMARNISGTYGDIDNQ